MLTHLNGYKREAVLAPLFKMLEATFDLFVPLVMADIVNVGIAAHDFHYILVRCGILLLLAVVGLACSLTAQYFSAKAAVGYSTSLRHALFEHIQRLGFTEMDTMGTSTLITRMTSDINQVQSGLNLFLRLFLRSPFVVVGAMVMAFTVNVRAAWIFVVAIPLLSVVVFGVMVITNPLYKTAQARLDRVLGLTRENLTGVRVVRAFDKEQSEIDRFESANDLLTRMQLHVGHISSLMSPLTYVIINLAIVALLYVGSIEINVGGMASGDVIALVNYMNQILVELVKLANLIVQVSKALACAGRVQAVLDTEPGMEFPAALKGEAPADKAGDAVRFDHVSLTYAGAGAPSLTDISFTAKRGQTIGVIGGTGSGKSSLINEILYKTLACELNGARSRAGKCDGVEGLEFVDKVIGIDQQPIGRTPRSNPATYTGVFADIRNVFVELPEAKIRGYKPGRFSFNIPGGRCEVCGGNGYKTIEMNFLPDVLVPCEACHGKRYNRETLEVRFKGKSIADVLDMTINQAVEFFENIPSIISKIKVLQDVGLGYIKLGQPSTTLSGGESQRVKLAAELSKRDTGKTLYILDEPTTGLHFEDIRVLLSVLNRLVDKGNTVIVIEHNLDIIKCADHIIDMGPEGGKNGGYVLTTGTPEEVCVQNTFTARY